MAWLKRRAINLVSPIGRSILGAREDGWTIGEYAADDATGNTPEKPIDWAKWKPGTRTAAQHGAALRGLLDDAGVTIKSVAQHRFDDMAKILADSLDAGDSVDELAAKLRPVLRDPQWAHMIAQTETSRAISAAAHEMYSHYGITKMSWAVAADDACALCLANEAAGLIGIDDRFPSGDAFPPGHPRCRCVCVPDE